MNNPYEDAQVEYHDICEQAKEISEQYESWDEFLEKENPEFKGKHGYLLRRKIREYFNQKDIDESEIKRLDELMDSSEFKELEKETQLKEIPWNGSIRFKVGDKIQHKTNKKLIMEIEEIFDDYTYITNEGTFDIATIDYTYDLLKE